MFDIHIFTLYSLNQTILKKVEKKGKVRDMISHKNKCHPEHGINTRSPPRSMLEDLNTGDQQWLITRRFFFFWLLFHFEFLPVPWALHLPPGPTASIKKEWEIKSYHAIDSEMEGWGLDKPATWGHLSTLILEDISFLYVNHNVLLWTMKLNKMMKAKDSLLGGSWTLQPGDFREWQAYTLRGRWQLGLDGLSLH